MGNQSIVVAGLLVAWIAAFGLGTAALASRRDRPAVLWLGFGIVLGPLAPTILWLAPAGFCRVCLMPSRGWLTTCWWCGSDMRARPPTIAAAPTGMLDLGPSKGPVAESGTQDPLATSTSPPPRTSTLAPATPTSDRYAGVPEPVSPTPAPSATTLLGRASSPFEVPQNRSHQGRAATAGGTIVDPASLRTGSTMPSVSAVDVAAPTQPQLLATGLYLGGTGRLDIGARYGIVVDGARLKVMGPFDGSVLALERWLYGLTATVAQDRVLIAIGARNTSIALVFGSISGMSATGLADELQSARDRARSVS